MPARVLVAGIGNIFLGDDGFGCEVVHHLQDLAADPDVRVVDYGIRGMHLTYDILEGWDLVVLVDALPERGNPAGVQVLDVRAGDGSSALLDAHGMDPAAMLAGVVALGTELPPTRLVGVPVSDVDERIGLSDPIAALVPEAAEAVRELVAEHRSSAPQHHGERVG
jgi:hydrogenase maturation protease